MDFQRRVKSEETGGLIREFGFAGAGGFLRIHVVDGTERDYEVTDTVGQATGTSKCDLQKLCQIHIYKCDINARWSSQRDLLRTNQPIRRFNRGNNWSKQRQAT